jgi:hypothetical protein
MRGAGLGANVDETERAELIAALHQSATFAEGLLDLNERLLDALTRGPEPSRRRRTGVSACRPVTLG